MGSKTADLYAILGIDRDALPEAIKKAYRRAAALAHPDVNPSPDAADRFHDIQLAYDVLSDPARRAKYDATGTIDTSSPDNAVANLIAALSNAFNEVLAGVTGCGIDPASVDMIEAMVEVFQHNESSIVQDNAQFARNRAVLIKIVDRFEAPDGTPNHMRSMIRGQIAEIDRMVTTNEAALEQARAPRLYLQGCKFRRQDPMLGDTSGWTTVMTFSV